MTNHERESKKMTAFVERLRRAAAVAGVGESQSAIAESLGLNRQTVYRWWKGGEPNAEITLQIAAKWGVSPEWLKFGVGEMAPSAPATLSPEEQQLIRDYRSATPKVRQVIATMTRAARKSIVTIAAVLPPLLAPADAEARILHNQNCAQAAYGIHIISRLRKYLYEFAKIRVWCLA